MNDINCTGMPPVPPQIPASVGAHIPLGEHLDDRVPITGPVSAFESVLRQPRRAFHQLRQSSARIIILSLMFVSVVCALVYGVVVGTFSGGDQLWIAPAKVAAGMFAAALICLPSLYILSCLSGSQARLVEVVGLVAGLLGLTTILLIGFAPVAWIFSQSTSSIPVMGGLHLFFWTIATCFGWKFLRNGFAHLSAKSGGTLSVWLVIFILVCMQMTTALRPIIGTSDRFLPIEKKFFVAHWLDTLAESNAAKPINAAQR